MFEARVANNLEIIALPGIAPGPTLISCSESTQKAGQEIQNAVVSGILGNANANNRKPFL